MKESVLSIKNLRKEYICGRSWLQETETFAAVRDVSFELYQGETLGLVGESGCGKSTLAKMIVKLLKPNAGEIYFEGQNILDMKEKKFRCLRPYIQLIGQNPFGSMDPRKRLIDTLSEGIRCHHISTNGKSLRGYLEEILRSCELQPEFLDRYPCEFSGGQLQRLAIARALALRPRVLVADEIVSALDVSVQGQILELLMKQKTERDMSLIFITHDLSVVRKISDRILVMKDGKILDEGNPEYIFEKSECLYTKKLKEAMITFPY